MSIHYNKDQKTLTIHTEHTTYQMLISPYGHLLHLYYGKRIQGSMEYLLGYVDRGFCGNPYEAEKDRTYSLDMLPQEYPTKGSGDYRNPSLVIRNGDGSFSTELKYQSHTIKNGKYSIPGLPAVYAEEKEAQSLEIYMTDETTQIQVCLQYGVLEDWDIITRNVKIYNGGQDEITLEKVCSANLDFLGEGEKEILSFYGRHAMERICQRGTVMHGTQSFGSTRGATSHQYSPVVILTEKNATEDAGDCYAMSFLYSGNFKCEVEKDQCNQVRMNMGIQNEGFSYRLKPEESFDAPEVILTYAAQGLAALSHQLHGAIRNHVCRGKFKLERRPILINNWEATYFDFTGQEIYDLAKQASELGVEMLVMDDGWFGERESDDCALGDWYVNESKMGGSLQNLVQRINGLGMKFGIWIEPEMVSEKSRLYQEHPDWALTIPGRKPNRSRYQLVLDFSIKEVVDAVFEQLCKVFDNVNIEYIKMDMNRSLEDVYSRAVSADEQGEVFHRYILGVYDFMERLISRYPDMFIEGCCGGGGRFDAGMLYYTPQIWCSDNTDAIDRIFIQYGTSFGFPISAVGSHVSAVPNHQTGRSTPLHTRGVVAMAGSFGYELDLKKLDDGEKEEVQQQILDYKEYWNVIQNGVYYRLSNQSNEGCAAWEFVSKDQDEVLLNVVTLSHHGNEPLEYVKLKGLDWEAQYEDSKSKEQYYGSALMYGGIRIPAMPDEYQAWQIHLKRI